MDDDFGCNNIQKHGELAVLQNYQHDKGKEQKGDHLFSFLDWILFCTIHIRNEIEMKLKWDEIVMEIEECKQKVPDGYVKSVSRVLLHALETSVVS